MQPSRRITSVWGPDNVEISGQKTETNLWGTLDPLVVYCPGKITPKRDNTTLIDYTDFLPTIADIAGIPKPTNYGTLDGVSFYDNLIGVKGALTEAGYFAIGMVLWQIMYPACVL